MSGVAEGVDQYFVEIVMEKQKDDPSLELIAVIPYQKRLDSLRAKRRTYEMLEACRDVVVIQEEYQPSVYSHRNRYMVEHSDRVIAVYDGREKGGTVRTIRFAHQMKKRTAGNTRGRNLFPEKVKQNKTTWHSAHLDSGRFLCPKGGIFMWSIITHLIAFTAGTVAGVVLLCLMQAGKMADEGYENMERRNNR